MSYIKFNNGGLTAIQSLTGNSGGAVSPALGGNITLVGSGTVNVVGNPGTNTLTISAAPDTNLTYVTTTDATYTVLTADQFVSVDASGGAKQVNLPNTADMGRVIRIKDQGGDAVANNITVTTPGGAVTIDGAVTFVMNSAYQAVNVIWNGTSYEIF